MLATIATRSRQTELYVLHRSKERNSLTNVEDICLHHFSLGSCNGKKKFGKLAHVIRTRGQAKKLLSKEILDWFFESDCECVRSFVPSLPVHSESLLLISVVA